MLDKRVFGMLDEDKLDRLVHGGASVSARIYISRDSGALCVGAEEVATAFRKAADKRGLDLEIVRNGSRGLYWLEPLVEVETPQGRVGYGPVKPADVAGLLDAGDKHRLCLGLAEDIPWLKNQKRLTFARCGIIDPRSLDDYKAHGGYQGLAKALAIGPESDRRGGRHLRLARPRRRRLPDRHQVDARWPSTPAAAEIHRLQRRRRR